MGNVIAVFQQLNDMLGWNAFPANSSYFPPDYISWWRNASLQSSKTVAVLHATKHWRIRTFSNDGNLYHTSFRSLLTPIGRPAILATQPRKRTSTSNTHPTKTAATETTRKANFARRGMMNEENNGVVNSLGIWASLIEYRTSGSLGDGCDTLLITGHLQGG
ncbi:hypothetical protein Fcan01_27218 [Folsomia candida]|uniref:Uncharacterized protein n=1 Tax=Folsomia candida TaxID=158441 RepID=A0A226CZ34_FOLCA|nr:hypothetical protein Fcan01_27218 [Folsomia candida]